VLSAALAWGMPSVAADPIRADLNRGHADSALQKLSAALAQNPSDAEGHNLRCRVFYQETQWDQAISDCEAAVQAEPGNSNFHLWLGRAYGQKAERVNLVAAYMLARKLDGEFQQAVQLDPRNDAALADLGEYDVEAPAIVGGGLARAQALVPQLQAVNPTAALGLQARIAESRKNFGLAETDLRAAIAQSPNPASPWMDLAAFYRRRGRIDDMLTAAHIGASLDRRHSMALVDGAENLIQSHREPQTAILWLQQYLDSPAQVEDAPAFAVRDKLAQLLAAQGDNAGAEQQIAAAHALASGYRGAAHGFASPSGR
jgi:Flp pilus assembly protein TadD